MSKDFCPQCNKIVDLYWELDTCDKNPDGLVNPPTKHGNMVGDCETCEDEYCNPDFVQVDDEFINDEYIKTHEVHARCSECYQFMESMK